MTVRPDSRVGTDLGPYRIESVIGRGGMGVVYLATHAGLDRKVALKLLAPDYSDDEAFRARFLRESRMAAAIDHPNIIPIYDAGEIGPTSFLAMRYVEGTDLETRVRDGPLPPRLAVHLLDQLASALDAAHAAGLVHRDVKPANVLVASGQGSDGADHAYLTDFGLSKRRDAASGLTRQGSFLGTVDYVAPEQIEGRAVDGRADQYALACLAFHALTGQVPFPRDSDLAVVNAHLRDDPPSLHGRRPDLASAADGVIDRGLAKRPDARYPTCRAFVDDLRAALGVTESDLHHRPASPSRQPALMAAAGLAALLLGVALAVAVGTGALGGGAAVSPAARPSPMAETESASPARSPAASANAPALGGPTEPFPDAAERALLDLLAGAPGGFAATCRRGSYASFPDAIPIASLECRPDIATGASDVTVRRFRHTGIDIGGAYLTLNRILRAYPFRRLPAGDCGERTAAIGPWSVAGEARGKLACYTEEATGDALLYWTYDSDDLLMGARNPRGDSPALYGFFERNARFIAP